LVDSLIHDDVAENLVTALPDPGIGSPTAIGSAPGRAAYWRSAFARGLTPKNHKEKGLYDCGLALQLKLAAVFVSVRYTEEFPRIFRGARCASGLGVQWLDDRMAEG